MKVTRFCSLSEFESFQAGKTLINTTDHYCGGKGGSTSHGFCFSPDEPATAWRYLKGIVTPGICMVLEIPDSILTPSFGKYVDYSNEKEDFTTCLKKEYCLQMYSKKEAKLIEAIPLTEFASPSELIALAIIAQNRRCLDQ